MDKGIIYKDNKVKILLADFPITKGHTIVIWNDAVKDLKILNKKDYDYIMDKVDETRNALIKTLKLKKFI